MIEEFSCDRLLGYCFGQNAFVFLKFLQILY
jgi:hypothetical protein